MAHTIFILGTDPQQCKELREILQDRIADTIVTAHGEDHLPSIQQSDTVIITAEEKNTGILYRRLLQKLEEQVHRAELLSDLIRLFSSSLKVEELLDRVVSKSSEVLGDASFIVLLAETGQLKLEAAFAKDKDRLVKMLINTVNITPQKKSAELLNEVLERKQPIIAAHLERAAIGGEFRAFIERHAIGSLLAVPIQTKEVVLGAFISTAHDPEAFTNDDITTASAVADFAAIALENAGLFAELQRSAITDSLTGTYNTRFFHEVLARETARADRYTTPLSLLMIDIDTFKLVNDTYGHVVGNKVLSHIAKVIERTVRNTDFVFRCGGDEFGVVLPGTNLDGAMRAAEKILHKVEASEILTALGYSGPVTVSIGVSEYHRGSHFETLVAEADQALYASKRSSKNCIRAYKANAGPAD
ncbi:MAG: sensor domain-containing diguanylate cyclase [Acidobacteria bacterium]|nr:sensor domain-containing diguanylate cyclase [Acidobacteriota bacterium]